VREFFMPLPVLAPPSDSFNEKQPLSQSLDDGIPNVDTDRSSIAEGGARKNLESVACAKILVAILDVIDAYAIKTWRRQSLKTLQLVYEGVLTGFAPEKLIEGDMSRG
jgi:hypothetical protein